MSQEESKKDLNHKQDTVDLSVLDSVAREAGDNSTELPTSDGIENPPIESVVSYGRLEEPSADESSESSSKSIEQN